MICSNFGKFAMCSGLLFRCKNLEHICQNLVKCHHHRSEILSKNIAAVTDKLNGKGNQKLYSTVSEVHERVESDLALNEVIDDQDQNRFSYHLRNFLYPDSKDEVILKLKSCSHINDVLNIINSIQYPTPQQLIQTLLVLRDIYKFDFFFLNTVDDKLHENPLFKRLIKQITNSVSQLDMEELSCCILYFSKFNVDKEIIFSLITTYDNMVKKLNFDQVSLSSLARVCVAVKEFQNIWSINSFVNYLPLVRRRLDSCHDCNNFRRITICLQKMTSILNAEIMKTYTEKCFMLMKRNEDSEAEVNRLRTIVRCVSFLNQKNWEGEYSKLIVDLLSSMHGRTEMLPVEDLHVIHSIAFGLQEPYKLLHELKSVFHRKILDGAVTDIDLGSVSQLYLYAGSRDMRGEKCMTFVKTYLDSFDPQSFVTSTSIMLLHYGLKLNPELTNKYWGRISNFLNNNDFSDRYENVVTICMRYLNFNTIVKYYHADFETSAPKCLHSIKERNKITLSPSERCILDLLLLFFNYGRSGSLESTYKYITKNVSRIEQMENASISFILFCTIKRISKSKTSNLFLHYYVQMSSALNNSATEFLKNNEDVSVVFLIHMFRAYCNREGTRFTELFRLLTDKLAQKNKNDLSSKKISTVIPCFYTAHLIKPDIVDKMVEYFIEEKNVACAFSVIQLLNYMFTFGYTPHNSEEFINVASEMILREKDELSAYHLIYGALSLCYYNKLPSQLAEYIFSIKFLEDVDNEVPLMILKKNHIFHQNFLELNRAVCSDFSNSNIPWFHEKYCKGKTTLDSRLKSVQHKELLQMLRKLINNEKALQVDCYSPYYHKIDFVLYTNKTGEPVDPNKCKPRDLRKIAILLNSRKASSPYYLGKGKFDLTIRQLEMLSYKVAVIESYQWNSMYMSEPSAKEDYLCNTIWSKGENFIDKVENA